MRHVKLGAVALLAAFAALVIGYLSAAAEGGWFADRPTIEFLRADAEAIRGKSIDRGPVRLFFSGEDGGIVIRFPNRSIQAEDYPTLRLAARTDATPLDARVLWRRADQPDRTYSLTMPWVGDGAERVTLSTDADWRGRIIGLAIAVRLPPGSPLAFASLSLLPDTASSIAREVLTEWAVAESWAQYSVNYLHGGSPNPRVPLPLAAGAIAVLAIAFYVALAKWRRVGVSVSVAAAIVLAAWLVLDLRWQVNLLHNLTQAAGSFAGKSIDDKHRAAEDQQIYLLAEAIRRSLPDGVTKVTLASDLTASPYFLGKLRYYLFPLWLHPRPEDAVSGEVVAVFQASRVGLQEATGSLQLPNGQSLAVERLGGTPPIALFRVR